MDAQQKAIAEEFDKYQGSYSDAVNEALIVPGLNIDFFTRVKADYILDLLAGHFRDTKNLSVLDIGCGVGNYHEPLRRGNLSLSGIDVSEGCVRYAKAAHPEVSYKTYDGTKLPYADATFDAAFTVCVMHHVPPAQWPLFISEMHRVLKPGGLAIVFEHNPRNPLTMRVVNRCPFDRHAVLLRAEETVARFGAAGFQAPHSQYILSVPAKNRFLRRVDRIFSRFPFGAQYYVTAIKPH